MENNRKLGLYVSYYLSRFDEVAYQKLGFGNMLETHNKIGELLSVKPHPVKNWRDEFDPLFGHRVGWHQKPMNPSRIRVAQALEGLDECQIRSIVKDILSGKIKEEPDEEQQLISVASNEVKGKSTQKFILRTLTGKGAEEYFQQDFSENKRPVDGELIDCRDHGVGYDFRIETTTQDYFVEVKGLSEFTGGLLLTSKEWAKAIEHGDNYFLCVVSNLNEMAKIVFIQNPARKLNPKRNIYTAIQISYSITQGQLNELND